MQKSVYLKPYELVDRETYRRFGESSYRLFDPNLLRLADWLRDQLGPVTVNDWYWRKDEAAQSVYEWSGFRTSRWDEVQPRANGKKRYSPYSDHALGNALDLKFKNHDAEFVRQFIKDSWDIIQHDLGIDTVTLEEGVSWVHIATRNNPKGVNSFFV